jgi:hypothetical protein
MFWKIVLKIGWNQMQGLVTIWMNSQCSIFHFNEYEDKFKNLEPRLLEKVISESFSIPFLDTDFQLTD